MPKINVEIPYEIKVVDPLSTNSEKDLLQQLLSVNTKILAELQLQTTLLNNLSVSLTPFGGK